MRTVFGLLSVLLLIESAASTLYQVVSVFRHGARYHLSSYYDGNDTKPWWGELTAVGMRQHENLGKMLRKEYIDNQAFLSEHYDRNQIEVYSTPYNRTIQSAQSQLYGLYPPGTGPRLTYVPREFHIPPYSNKSDIEEQNYALPNAHQTIPIKFNNKIILEHCINEHKEVEKNYLVKQAEYQNMDMTYSPFMDQMAQLFKINRSEFNLSKLGSLASNLNVDLFLGRPLPTELKDEDLKNMQHILFWKIQFEHSLDLMKAQNSGKFQKVIDTFDARTKSIDKYPIKWTFLSAHDTHVGPLLNALNITSSTCIEELYRTGTTSALNCENGPEFASSLIFELHSDNKKDFYVKVRYNGKYVNLCEKKEEKCSYTDFKNRIKKGLMSDADIEKLCGNRISEGLKGYSEYEGSEPEETRQETMEVLQE